MGTMFVIFSFSGVLSDLQLSLEFGMNGFKVRSKIGDGREWRDGFPQRSD